MDKLTRSLLGKYECVINLYSEISHEAVFAARQHINLEEHIKRTMATQLAAKLLNDKATVFNESKEPGGNIVFTAKMIAMTEDEAEALVHEAYQAGLDAQKA